ncbi:MAG: replicative DNA helicase, partial [Abditibacteriota bacterium]|nr:replicative DNA helicase [Abditibacteriota bacterium]
RIVEKKAVLRRLIAAGHEIAALGYDGDADVEEATDKAENIVFKIAEKRSGKYFSAMPELIRETWEWMDRRAEMKGEASGSPTGFVKLDQMTSGLQPSDLIIIAARPSMGKTALALNLAVNTALSEDKAVAIFSLEMSESQLIQRIICSQARVNAHRMRTGYFRDEEWGKVAEVANRLYNAPLFIDDTTDMTVLNMRAKCRRLKAERGLGLIVVDYLQLMSSHRSTDNRVQEISEIARGLKSLAREMNVPVIALSQLSRAVERRDDKRPMLSDLRESGSIEAEADVVMMLYRDSYYKRKEVVDFKKDEGDEGEEPVTEADNTAEVIIAKHRNGPTGTVKLAFVQEFASFENLEENMKEE